MAAELITPTDELSGLPYLIAPKQYWLPLGQGDVANRHHLWHPSNDPVFETVEGLALRASMLQTVEVGFHNQGPNPYHKFYKGPELPRAKEDVFRRCILACAGVLPDGVIDLKSGEPVERTATVREMRYFRTPSDRDEFGYRYVRYGYGQIKNFLVDYVTGQDLQHIGVSRIDEFLHTKDVRRKWQIGKLLLTNAVAAAGETVRDDYFVMRKENMLHPRMPSEPQTLVSYKLGSTPADRLGATIPKLEAQLLAAA